MVEFQNYEDIKISEVQLRQRDGEVLVKIAAAGVNFVDLLYVSRLSSSSRIINCVCISKILLLLLLVVHSNASKSQQSS